MSILTQLLKREITFSQAAGKAAGWASALVGHDANLTHTAGAVLSDVKQGASNAVESADSALHAHFQEITVGVEAALEGALAKATAGRPSLSSRGSQTASTGWRRRRRLTPGRCA